MTFLFLCLAGLRNESGNLPQQMRQDGLKEVRPVMEIHSEP
jgi:hypothetical protein